MNLNTFEIAQNIRSKKFVNAETAINFFITESAKNNGQLITPTLNDPLANKTINIEEVHYTFCNQFTSLISELFSSPSYKPLNETINVFIKYKFVIEWIFSASIWNNTDALIEHLGLIKLDAAGKIKLNKRNIPGLLMLITISSKHRLPWPELFKLCGVSAYLTYTCLLSQPIPALSKESNSGFNYLLESAKGLPVFDLPLVGDLGTMNYPFFACSYATSPDKYEFKKWLTSLIRHNLPQWLSPEVKQYIDDIPDFKQKPKLKMAVMLEQYLPNHAMYRCFNNRLQSLSRDYELIAFIDEMNINNEALSFFDKVIGFENVFNINQNAELVLQEKPDIVFYPSIGLNFWGIYLSQLRLAPKQLMMGGHPSSSFSPEIDGFLMLGNTFSLEDIQQYTSEKVVMIEEESKDTGGLTMHEDIDESFLKNHNQFIEDEQEIKIGINGILTKVNYSIIDVCKRIQANTNKKVTFYFYCASHKKQLPYLSSKKQLSRMLKSFKLIHFSSYKKYMISISECHFLLPTLPFGGSNSNIDAVLLNKPKLFLKGNSHLYTYTDEASWGRFDLVKELGCNSIEELITKSFELINNTEYRKTLHHQMVKNCNLDKIYNDDKHTATNLLFNAAIMNE